MVPLWLQALVLGVVQGLSEFIPISSSAHLVLVPYLLGWDTPTLAFDVALHTGTLLAVLLYFRRDLVLMVWSVIRRGQESEARLYRRLALLIMLGTVPVALIGYVFKEPIEHAFTSPWQTAVQLLVTAALLVGTEKFRDRRVATAAAHAAPAGADRQERVWTGDWIGAEAATVTAQRKDDVPIGADAEDPAGQTLTTLSPLRSVAIGLMQALALLPGISRSGATIAGGVWGGLTREAATRFSFLLSIPALIGASLLNITDLDDIGSYSGTDMWIGVIAATISGYIAIRWLITLVARERLIPFAWYCVAAAIVGFVGTMMIG
jgi:undecaprenyl-diphosphatase